MIQRALKTHISIVSIDDTTLRTFATTPSTELFSIVSIKETSLEILLSMPTDVFILDEKNALKMSTLDICKIIRTKNEEVQIIILTDDFDISEKIIALELGADDYLAKPANRLEVLARIKGISKRMRLIGEMIVEQNEFRFNDLYLDSGRNICVIDGVDASLTKYEFQTLLQLVQNKGKTVSRATLLRSIWGLSNDEHTRPVDDVVRRLRKKLSAYESTSQIFSHWGHGYRIEIK